MSGVHRHPDRAWGPSRVHLSGAGGDKMAMVAGDRAPDDRFDSLQWSVEILAK